MSKLSAWLQSHHKQALAGGAGVAVVAGLYVRHRKASGAAPLSLIPGGSGSSAGGGGSSGTVIAPATYDSIASDLYNSIQPQIESLQRSVDALGLAASVPVPNPTPAPVATTPVVATAPVVVPTNNPTPAPAPTPVPGAGAAPTADPALVRAIYEANGISWGGNDPAVNPHVSPAAPAQLAAGSVIPPATGLGQRYTYTDVNGVTYPFVAG